MGLARRISIPCPAGLQPILPSLCRYITSLARSELGNCRKLYHLLLSLAALARNPHVDLTHHLHVLMPIILTCLVAKRLGRPPRRAITAAQTAELLAAMPRVKEHVRHVAATPDGTAALSDAGLAVIPLPGWLALLQ